MKWFVDAVVGDGEGVLDLAMERINSAGVGARRCPSELEDAARDPLVTARSGAAAARASAREGWDAVSGVSGSGVSSGVVAKMLNRLDMGNLSG